MRATAGSPTTLGESEQILRVDANLARMRGHIDAEGLFFPRARVTLQYVPARSAARAFGARSRAREKVCTGAPWRS